MELRDSHIVLRPIRIGDEDASIAGLNDPEVARFMTLIPYPYTRADAAAWVGRCRRVWEEGSSQPFAITEGADGELIGGIEVAPRGSIGYRLAASHRGRGIATRALRLVCAGTSANVSG